MNVKPQVYLFLLSSPPDLEAMNPSPKSLFYLFLWKIFIAAGITGGICLIIALFGGSMFDFTAPVDAGFARQLPDFAYQGILAEREALMKGDAFRSFLFIVLAAATLGIYTKGWLKWGYMVALLGVLVMADMWPINKRYLNDSSFVTKKSNKAAFQMLPYEQQILQDKDPHFCNLYSMKKFYTKRWDKKKK